MVPITKGSIVAENADLIVVSDDGQYADTDLIACAHADTPDIASAMLQAQFVKYGGVVYRFNTPEELGQAVYALDKDSTHDAVLLYKEQLARDRARSQGTLEPSDPVPAPDSPTVDETPAPPADPIVPPTDTPPPAEIPITPEPNLDTTSGQVLGTSTESVLDTATSTTTPDSITTESTSTPGTL